VRPAEAAIAAALALLGLRSLVHWARRPFESADIRDHLLFAIFVTARAGVWFSLAGMFAVYALVATVDPVTGERIPAQGRAFADAVGRYEWMFMIPIAFGVVQFLAGWFLGHRDVRSGEPSESSRRTGLR
jgi:hypothetical protein